MVVVISYRLLKYNKLLFFNRNKCINNNIAYLTLRKNQSTSTKEYDTKVSLSNGTHLTISGGNYARLCNGCAVVSLGDTSVMVTAVAKSSSSIHSFIPLSVDYRQKAAAAGRIPTNFLRREIGMTEHEILTSRLLDRSVRPLFPQNEKSFETQIVCNMLAIDGIHDPDVISINGASAALSMSNIPWNGPVGAVRIGLIDNNLVINPTRLELQQTKLNLIVTASKQNSVIMLEGYASDIPLGELMKAIKIGVKECQTIINSIQALQAEYGKEKMKLADTKPENIDEIQKYLLNISEHDIRSILQDFTHDKLSRDNAIANICTKAIEKCKEVYPDLDIGLATSAFYTNVKQIFRSLIFETNKRCDGRGLTDLRDISCKVNLFKPLHGSSLFQRGQTQVLCTVTLDSLESTLRMDTTTMLTSGLKEKNFFLHYEFPPYATNEIGRTGFVGRREMGHGALAEKGLKHVLPTNYPFTVRLTSEVLESNGSSSMASVCGGSLALMDAGVPISRPVAGVAMGLITRFAEEDSTKLIDYKILTDILGMEDYLGDMDFKIAGGKNGVTALQADIKVPGLPLKIIMETLQQAWPAKQAIIRIMESVISKPREEQTDKMPVVEDIQIPVHQIGKFLGLGGSNLKKLFLETGVHAYVKENNTYTLFAPNKAALEEAKEMIAATINKEREPTLEFGGIYSAKIVEIRETGVMVTLYSNMVPTFLPNSQLDQRRILHPSALGLEIGQEIHVKYFGRDPNSGQIRISRKVLQEPSTVTKTLN